ncbi:hypothetical protein JZ751_022168 [Albula glossodonta]|uniref:sphingomyelin phosphodiesterase n=1 Tax=Albula glossodonta TaxID=121402 RepID=A0A8T2N2G8_9TELE|nr:hypothetical protein JZ751_022168 [Albula glossodonta]
MTLRESPFSNGFAEALHAVGWALIFPCFWFLDRLIAVCMSTTLERTQRVEEECYLHPLKVFFGAIIFFILFLVAAPFAFLGFLLWAPLQAVRRPFSYHKEEVIPREVQAGEQGDSGKATFTFATANLCLLPDSLARFNNLGHTQLRAAAIGRCIAQGVSRPRIRIFVDSPSSCGTLSPSSSLLTPAAATSYGATEAHVRPPLEGGPEEDGGETPGTKTGDAVIDMCGVDGNEAPCSPDPPHDASNFNQNSNQQCRKGQRHPPRALGTLGQGDDVPWEVSTFFPANADIVCLEEVFDKRAAVKLVKSLGPLFGHILYDVGVYACQTPGCCSAFKFFNSGLFLASRYPVLEAQYHCYPNGSGEDAFAAKGLLSAKMLICQNQSQNTVGYFNCTHLYAPEGEGAVRCEQLNMLSKWIKEFQLQTKQPNETMTHWSRSTVCLRTTETPAELGLVKRSSGTLEREDLRKRYISPPVPLAGCPLVYPEPGHPWVGRRIDYILYRESSLAKQCHTEVEEYTFVTQLAGLTDHIPVGLRLAVTMEPDRADL